MVKWTDAAGQAESLSGAEKGHYQPSHFFLCFSLLPCVHLLWYSESGRRGRRGVEVAAGTSSNGEPRQPGNGTRAGGPEETATQYAVIAIVPVFCLMGLLGILVCNLLKRKGYHCTAQKEVGPSSGGGGSGKTWLGPRGKTRGFRGNLPGLGV